MASMTTPASKSSGFIGPSRASQIQSSLTGPDFGVVDSVSGRTMDNVKGILLNTYTHPTKSIWLFLNLLIMVIALQFLNYSCHPTVFMSRGLSSVSIVVLLTARPTCCYAFMIGHGSYDWISWQYFLLAQESATVLAYSKIDFKSMTWFWMPCRKTSRHTPNIEGHNSECGCLEVTTVPN